MAPGQYQGTPGFGASQGRRINIRQRVQRIALCLEHLRKSGIEAKHINELSPSGAYR
jgi:hypothetical protein